MPTFFLVITFVLMFAFTLGCWSKLPLAKFIPTAFFYATLVTIIVGTNFGLNAVLLFLVINLIFLFLFGLFQVKKLGLKKIISIFLTPSVITFLLLASLTFTLSRKMKFVEWDEFTHWGFIVKAMYLFDVFGPESPAHITIPNTVPGLASIGYIISKTGSQWNEGNLYWAYHLITISLLIPALSKFTLKKFYFLIFPLLLTLITTVMFYNTYMSVYADPLLGLIFGYLIFLALDKKLAENSWLKVNFIISSSAYIFIKDLALALVVIPIFIAGLNVYIRKNQIRKNFTNSIKTSGIFVLLTVTSILIVRFVWSRYIVNNSGISSSALGAATFDGPQRLIDTLQNSKTSEVFGNVLERSKLSALTPWNGFNWSYSNWIIVITVLLLLIFIAIRNDRDHKTIFGIGILAAVAGSVFYLLIMLMAYMTAYSGESQLTLTSFERYVSSYPAGLLFFAALKCLELVSEFSSSEPSSSDFNKKTYVNFVTISLAILLLFNSPPFRLTDFTMKPSEYSSTFRQQFDGIKQKIASGGFTAEDKFWIIAQHTVGFENYLLQYELLPASVGYFPFSIGTPSGPGDIWTERSMTAEKWEKEISNEGIDFVIVFQANETFVQEFGSIFENPETLLNGQGIYKVVNSESGIKLFNYR